MGMLVEKKGNLLGMKRPNKWKKLKQLVSYFIKLLKYWSLKDGVEGICNIHL
jgi:hypothetical protein